MRKTLTTTLTTGALLAASVATALPANAAYGDESVINSNNSNRGLIVKNDGQAEFILGIGEGSISAGYHDVDEFRLKTDQCAKWRTTNGDWTKAYRGPLTQRVGEWSLIVQTGTVTVNPYTLTWVCAL